MRMHGVPTETPAFIHNTHGARLHAAESIKTHIKKSFFSYQHLWITCE